MVDWFVPTALLWNAKQRQCNRECKKSNGVQFYPEESDAIDGMAINPSKSNHAD